MDPSKSTRILHNSSSKQKDNTFDLFDRISDLPDSILSLILSNLPTKNAFATSILSKRWKFIWTTVHNLDFCLDDDSSIERALHVDINFARFVNRVLLLLDGGFLNKFRLVWSPRFIPSQVSKWINIAIIRNVHHLSVSVQITPDVYYPISKIPNSLFSCDSLQSLELIGHICVSDAMVVYLPRLETLKLVSVFFEYEESFEKLISRCPMLNYLHLSVDMEKMVVYTFYKPEFTYIISSTSLRRLELFVEHLDILPFYFHLSISLKLEVSSLEYLKLVGCVRLVFVPGTLCSLVEADFRIKLREDECSSLVKAVRAFDCAKNVTISIDAMMDHRRSSQFTRLTKLEAEVSCCYCSSLLDFIQNLDSLEVLTIHQTRHWNLEEFNHDQSKCIALPVEVPRCLSNKLKTVAFKSYCGHNDEREMIGYILKHGNALKVMQVTCCARTNIFGSFWEDIFLWMIEDICRLPRKSQACKIEFMEFWS